MEDGKIRLLKSEYIDGVITKHVLFSLLIIN